MKLRTLPAFLLLALPLFATAPFGATQHETYKMGDWEDETGYRQAVRIGNTLYVSGSVGFGSMDSALKEAYDQIATTLKHFGLGFENVVKENAYATDIEALKANKEIRKTYYKGHYPAATWVQVQRLFTQKQTLEVEVIAVFPEVEKPSSK